MRAIVCSRGKGGGCKVINTPDALDFDGPPDLEAAEEPKLSPIKPFHPEPPASYWPPARVARSPNLVRIPAATLAENCTGAHCKARIYKVEHPKTGKLTPAAVAETIKLPKDGAIVPTGAFAPYLDAAPGRETIERDGMGYSHFIDCPDAPSFKRK